MAPARATTTRGCAAIDAVNEVYTETGRWTKFVDTGEPFPINLPIGRITPRAR
ncbi:hypothetical protein [Micromonospora cremea]|uniref:hypothetical protein n=1 Tax=Micromonospora cremea TaxID=709881 RepID=UPI000AADAEF6|nr:hypothetical protein [Micromonospora cremea]